VIWCNERNLDTRFCSKRLAMFSRPEAVSFDEAVGTVVRKIVRVCGVLSQTRLC
jgi:hypothetical protein